MGALIELILFLADVAISWRFWVWFFPGCLLAFTAYNMGSNEAISKAVAIGLLVYSGWRGYRAEQQADDDGNA